MASFDDVDGFDFDKVNVHFEDEVGRSRLVVDRGFLRVQRSQSVGLDPLHRLAMAVRSTNGSQGSDVLFIPFELFVGVERNVVKSSNGKVRKGKLTFTLASAVSCGSFSTTKIVMKMDVGDSSLLYSNIFKV